MSSMYLQRISLLLAVLLLLLTGCTSAPEGTAAFRQLENKATGDTLSLGIDRSAAEALLGEAADGDPHRLRDESMGAALYLTGDRVTALRGLDRTDEAHPDWRWQSPLILDPAASAVFINGYHYYFLDDQGQYIADPAASAVILRWSEELGETALIERLSPEPHTFSVGESSFSMETAADAIADILEEEAASLVEAFPDGETRLLLPLRTMLYHLTPSRFFPKSRVMVSDLDGLVVGIQLFGEGGSLEIEGHTLAVGMSAQELTEAFPALTDTLDADPTLQLPLSADSPFELSVELREGRVAGIALQYGNVGLV